jgi:hypothetical protein
MYTFRLRGKERLMAAVILTDSDLMYLLTLLRSSDRPLTTAELIVALRARSAGR